MADDPMKRIEAEARDLQSIASWLAIRPFRDGDGKIQVEVVVSAKFMADPSDVAGSIVREIHSRLDEFDARME